MQPQQPNNQPQPVPIQSAPVSQPIQPVQPMLYGQPQPMMAQNIMVAQNSGNGASTTGLVMGILAISTFALGFIPFLCFFFLFSWLFALLAVIFGHIGASQGSKTGVGGGQGVAGLVLGYLTLAGYLIPFLLLGSIGAGASL
ncbi:MAG TPA: hypothetical protein D7H87_04190 [Candidatus Poseidoniales archaeon]|nr:hypothetical protein [Euryarchaeota archaeon]DAC50387.1 MAG TPA: hypothetical protein D7H87_04190 [Candidatus Poseidoniales archaeon]HII32485.1 hypothetical protein [Candidatus Poseidoniaceae archaeon]|tara:strand:- start:16 stop:441 length:426 start_codon:yes stop_codon:yes gene_type:complete